MHTAVSEVRRDTPNTYTVVSEKHREMLKTREGAGDSHRMVCDNRTLSPAELILIAPRLNPG